MSATTDQKVKGLLSAGENGSNVRRTSRESPSELSNRPLGILHFLKRGELSRSGHVRVVEPFHVT